VAKKEPSWWRLKEIRHRDAVILAIASAACLLAGELADSGETGIPGLYARYIAPYLESPGLLVLIVILLFLGFTTVFGGFFVLLGGLHFSWGRVGRGRFFVGLGLGVGLLGLLSRFARTVLTTGHAGEPFGDPVQALFTLGPTLVSVVGILFGLASHTLMGRYALMLKKHAKRILRRWRRGRRLGRPSSRL
jgi:hypothetical protein